ncbi:MAG TPA: pyruvate dehydrogenase (acetyl-transferring), homodimeric type, partial [Candidatus Poseidoniia archaeon]|nr:pyruvate dehydrogenase (acetyl-transferring), homodimeric type [Candidatus Poseidoniia archaeon]
LHKEAEDVRRWNILHPELSPRKSYLEEMINSSNGPVIAVSDYVKLVSEQIAPYIKCPFVALGTDGFGRSDTRENLRKFFEIDADHIAAAAISTLMTEGQITKAKAESALKNLKINPDAPDPARN